MRPVTRIRAEAALKPALPNRPRFSPCVASCPHERMQYGRDAKVYPIDSADLPIGKLLGIVAGERTIHRGRRARNTHAHGLIWSTSEAGIDLFRIDDGFSRLSSASVAARFAAAGIDCFRFRCRCRYFR